MLLSFTILVSLAACNNRNLNTINIGHRGAKGHVAENTIPSIKKAMQLGVQGVEFDVFRCKSGEIVLLHDKTLDRTTNATGNVENYTLQELKEVVVEGQYNIATLGEALDAINNSILVNIELKGKNTSVRTIEILTNYIDNKGWNASNFIISSFNWDELKAFRNLANEIAIGVLTEEDPLKAISFAKEIKASAIHPYYKYLTQEKILAIQREGFKVYTWTVNSPEDIKQLKQWQVDGIITDYPERVNE